MAKLTEVQCAPPMCSFKVLSWFILTDAPIRVLHAALCLCQCAVLHSVPQYAREKHCAHFLSLAGLTGAAPQ
eukprot:CAMPEP_0181348792 /NCGR_PEP_ID=MMETSP1106-20121128/376_1 /TAXON_ID=81844 /ORGANISM="Mantoniella antarctica, Strain SL-175" /LENGTH=71 /DNA_ID=CAMNT_0023461131 /DNA_START=191 /DNA_END=406 /DNA_ORIENTATION=-